jgi:RND family efflux transporter MFP subunit
MALVVAALGAVILFVRHHHRLVTESRQRNRDVDRGTQVYVAAVKRSPAVREVTLPADVRGFLQATVYAKVSGYVKSMAVDKGDAVRESQLLGILESPEIDQQVAAAEADLVIKKRTFERYQKLVQRDFVSAQDFETTRAQYEVAQATLRQTRAIQGYQTLRAPFAGTVTARYVDPGALVPAATGATQSALPLVDVADLRRLRITLFVQQDAAPFLKVGDVARISIDERPDLKIEAPIARLAQALDPRSRTMLCEIWLDNPYRLYPGTFVHVTLKLKASPLPMAPSSALLIHDNKPALATIRDSKVHFVPVRTGLDDGHHVQILEGIQPGDKVVVNLPAEIAEGALVRVREQPPEGGKSGAGGGQKGADEQKGQGGEQKGQGGDKGAEQKGAGEQKGTGEQKGQGEPKGQGGEQKGQGAQRAAPEKPQDPQQERAGARRPPEQQQHGEDATRAAPSAGQ